MNDLQTQCFVKRNQNRVNNNYLDTIDITKTVCIDSTDLTPLSLIVLGFFPTKGMGGYTLTQIIEKSQQEFSEDISIDFIIDLLKDFKKYDYLIEKESEKVEKYYTITDKSIQVIRALSVLKMK